MSIRDFVSGRGSDDGMLELFVLLGQEPRGRNMRWDTTNIIDRDAPRRYCNEGPSNRRILRQLLNIHLRRRRRSESEMHKYCCPVSKLFRIVLVQYYYNKSVASTVSA